MQNVTPNNEAVFLFSLIVDQQAAREFAINLNEWSGRNHGRPLRIDLNSGGGNIADSLFLFEELSRLRACGHKLTIAALGRAASCASWLLQAADRRIIGARSWILIHEVSSKAEGTLTDIKREVARMEELQEESITLLLSRSKLTRERILKEIENGRDWWINADEALKLGLVDAIEIRAGLRCLSA